MSLNKYKMPLSFDLKPSKFLFYFILFIHLLALSVLILRLDINILFLLFASLFIFINMYLNLKQNNSIEFNVFIEKIEYLKNMEWRLRSSDKKSSVAILQNNWFVLPWLLILYFKSDEIKDMNVAVIILPDMIKKNDMRQLKLYLSQIKS